MSIQYIGYSEVNAMHAWQPLDSELCFATLMRTVSGATIPEAHGILLASGLSAEDGSTDSFIKKKELHIVDTLVTLEPFQTPIDGAEDADGVMGSMEEQFEADKGVILLHKKNGNPDDGRHHYILLTGHLQEDGVTTGKEPLHTIDPLEPQPAYVSRGAIAEKISNSLDFAGLYAYALDTAPIK